MNAHHRRKANAILLLAAVIWGLAFVAQRVGMRHLGPLTFNGVRFALGALVLLPWAIRGVPGGAAGGAPLTAAQRRDLLKGGALAGLFVFGGATLQQVGLVTTTAGKAGFITSLYVVLVPILGLWTGQRAGRWLWLGAVLAGLGLTLLSADESLGRIAVGDGLVLVGAFFWAGHVLLLGKISPRHSSLRLATVQFSVCALLSLAAAAVFETAAAQDLLAAAVPILYAGLLSVAVAYTLQVVGQKHAHPTHAAIILSFESVFAALGGWLVLGETLQTRELIGCLVMLAGVVVAQVQRRA